MKSIIILICILPIFGLDIINGQNNDQCGWICSLGSFNNSHSKDLQVFFRANFRIFLNITAKVSLIFDISTSKIVLLNGNNGKAIEVNKDNVIVTENIWKSNETFQTFLNSLSSITSLEKLGKTLEINKAQTEISAITTNLGIENKDLIQLPKILNLTSLSNSTGNGTINGGLDVVIRRVKVLQELINIIPGGLQHLKKSGIKLNLLLLFNSSNGLEAFIIFLNDVSSFNLAEILGKILNNPDSLTGIIEQLAGDGSDPTDNTVKLIHTAIEVVNQKQSVDVLIRLLIKLQQGNLKIDTRRFHSIIKELLAIIEKQNTIYHNSVQLKGLTQFLENILNNRFVYVNINISEIIQLLTMQNSNNIFKNIIQILMKMGSAINPINSIPRFIQQFSQMTHTNATNFTRMLAQNSLLNNTILNQILQHSGLSNIPVIGSIVEGVAQGPAQVFGTFVNNIQHSLGNLFGGSTEASSEDRKGKTLPQK